MTPANDNKPRKTNPLVTRLRRAGRADDVKRLAWLAIPDALPQAVNDEEKEGMAADSVHEMRPSDREIETALKSDPTGKECFRYNSQGHLTQWRIITDEGEERWFRAREGYRHSKGARRPSAGDTEDASPYLALRGGYSPPDTTPRSKALSEGADYCRMRAAYWVEAMGAINDARRLELDRLGVGARAAFAQARANVGLQPAERLQDGVAWQVDFLCGKVDRGGKAKHGSFVGAPDDAENRLIAQMDAPAISAELGEHAAIIDMSLSGSSAAEIAVKLGYAKTKAGERRVVAAQDAALVALAAVQEKLAA
jgi:hypothetical protein